MGLSWEGMFGEAVDRIGGQPISARMARKAPIRHLDPTLLLVTLILTAYGAVVVLSVTIHRLPPETNPNLYLIRQVLFAAAGMGILVAMSFVDYRHFRALAPFVYIATVVGLVAVLTPLGEVAGGARRWISFGAFQAQPSELAKVAVIVVLAAYLSERRGEVRAIDVLFCCVTVAIPAVLIFLEPDLGTMMVFVALTAGLLLVGGAKIRHFLALGGVGIVAIAMVLQLGVLQDYQVQRITAFLDPEPDPQSVGYNLVQAEIAIASGGLRGKGMELEPSTERRDPTWGLPAGHVPDAPVERTQTALDFVPEQHTDFIFTAVGEQLGFVGSATLLGLFAFLIWRAVRIAALSKDMFGTLLATGVASLWAFQLFVNIGMTMGIMPITGIPLPFVSYGGSSLITNYIAVGLLLNVHMRRFL
ncbi:MAG: rod shape-determining protein RodA [Actinobacteria bacterium]|nr:rod shape-determining protein RodA [Actinomycetota bacterium]